MNVPPPDSLDGEPQYPPADPQYGYGYPQSPGYGYPQNGGYGYPQYGGYGYPKPAPARICDPITGWALLAAGILAVIGSVSPWARVTFLDLSINGTEGDGKVSVICAAVVAVMGLLIALRAGRLWTSIVALVFAAFTALIGVIDIGSINGSYGPLADENVPDGAVSTAYGIWLVVVGGVLGVVAAIVAIVRRAEPARVH